MKKILLILFLVFNSFIKTDEENGNEYFASPLNTRLEALGGTGMIFGEDYGSLYLAPTSMFKKDINFQLGTSLPLNNYGDNAIMLSLFLKSKIGNFFLGWHTIVFENDYILTYSLEIYNFSIGIGCMYYNGAKLWTLPDRKYLSTKASIMYESFIGNFSLLLNNFPFEMFNDPSLYFDRTIYSIPNLRIGYGKEFRINNNMLDKIYLSFEIDNLLMKNAYINRDERDYTVSGKIHLGIEGIKNLNEVVKIYLRSGIKNFLPTFGIETSFFECIGLAYAFTNKGFNYEKAKFMNYFSIEFTINNIYFQYAREFMKKHYKSYIDLE